MRKGFVIFVAIMSISWIAHSQPGTQDSIVTLPKWMAVQVLQDLERLDACDSNTVHLEKLLVMRTEEVALQERIAQSQQQQLANLNAILTAKAEQLTLNEAEVQYWQKQYRRQKRQKFAVGGVSLVVIILALL